ncbi:MerR family transcriptional regulator, partial [Listeria monocytogenes]|nr:MerR family transcriptional regulator [Listeria monocytogenes]
MARSIQNDLGKNVKQGSEAMNI